jgi:hypothetical protein
MRTDRFCLLAAAAVALQIVLLGSVSGPLVVVFNVLAYASLTLLLWIATRGSRPIAVPGSVILLGAFASNPAVAAAAAVLTAGSLFLLQGNPVCAESSPR